MNDIYYEAGAGFCSCLAAMQGTFCKHQCAIQIKFNLSIFPNAPLLTFEDRKNMLHVANGSNKSLNFDSFLKGMTDVSEETNNMDITENNNETQTENVTKEIIETEINKF